MIGIHHYSDMLGLKYPFYFSSDLYRQALLYLGSLGIVLNNPVDLGKANHFSGRKIGNVRFAVDRDEVMFAMGVERDVFFHQHLIVVVPVFK